MIYSLAEKIAAGLFDNDEEKRNEITATSYGLYVVISNFLYFILCVIFGYLSGNLSESIIFFFVFKFIKKYSGGYHAKSEITCFIISSFSIFLSVIAIMFAEQNQAASKLLIIAGLLSVPIICMLSPIEATNKPLEESETKLYKRKCIIRICAVTFMLFILLYFQEREYANALCTALLLDFIFVVIGKATQPRNR